MQLSKVLAHLPEGALVPRGLSDPDANVYTISFLAPNTQPIRDDVLYFGDASALSQSDLNGATINLVLFGPNAADLACGSGVRAGSNVMVLEPHANVRACYNAIQELFIEDQAQIGIVRRMMMAHFSNKGIAYLVDEAAKALDNPIDVIDTAYHHITYSIGVEPDEMTDAARHLADVLSGDLLSDEQIDYISSSGIDSELARTTGPLTRYNHIVKANTMTKAVMANGVCIAFVMLIELNHPFRARDVDCFDRFAEFVGQEMQKSEVWKPAAGEMSSYFLTNLLGDASPSEAVTQRRLKELNFHPKRALYVLCLHTSGEGLQQLQAERIAAHLRHYMGRFLYTRYHQNLVVVYTQDDDGGIGDRILHLLQETATLNELSVGISNPYYSLTNTRKAYDQARAAIRLGEQRPAANASGTLYSYGDYSDLHLLEIAGRRSNLSDFCHPSLVKLQEYDARHGTELMDTLYCFLVTAGSNSLSAQMLNLHKNSMIYRMSKISSMLNLDLSSGETRFKLFSGLRILMYLGLFKPRMG